MENVNYQQVQPEVSLMKFNKEVEEFKKIEKDWRRKGVICLKTKFPNIEFVFMSHNQKPVIAVFGVTIDFSNYDLEPPSVKFIDPFTGELLLMKDIQIRFFQINEIPHPVIANQKMHTPQPILMGDKNDQPFLCIPGVREYHNHPFHTGNSWLLHKGKGEGGLNWLIDQLYNHSIPHISGFNMNFQISIKQF